MSGAHGARCAVAYLRVTDDLETRGRPVADASRGQRLAVEAWAEREGVEIRSWQLDVVPGDTPIAERPGLLAAYAAIRAYRAGILVAANAESFGHDELVCWLIERAALTQGAALRTADGSRREARARLATATATTATAATPIAHEESGHTRAALELARAHHRVTLRARVRAALAEKRARGERVGTVPYGYRLAADGLHVEPHDAEQKVVATVRRLSSEGLSQRAIVARLASSGVVGRTGAPLRQTQIVNILRAAR